MSLPHHPSTLTPVAVQRRSRSLLLRAALESYLVDDVVSIICVYATQPLLLLLLHHPRPLTNHDHPAHSSNNGSQGGSSSALYGYDPAAHLWQPVCEWPTHITHLSTHALLRDTLYFLARRQAHCYLFALNVTTGHCTEIPLLQSSSSKTHHTLTDYRFSRLAVLSDELYVFGNTTHVGALLRFNPLTKTWHDCTSSQHPWTFRPPALAVLHGCLYAIANTLVGTTTAVQRYDPVLDKWTACAPIPTPLAHYALCASDSSLYCCGGYSSGFLKTCVRYCMDRWTAVASFHSVSQTRHRAVWMDGHVVLCGDVMERYNPATNVWTVIPTDDSMPSYASSPSLDVAVVW